MSSLVIDYQINKIIQKIQNDYREKGKEVSYGTIVRVVESQLRAIVDGMAEGNTITLKYIGTFIATKKRVDVLNRQYEKKGKRATLVDNGVMRMVFKDGKFYKENEILEVKQ